MWSEGHVSLKQLNWASLSSVDMAQKILLLLNQTVINKIQSKNIHRVRNYLIFSDFNVAEKKKSVRENNTKYEKKL